MQEFSVPKTYGIILKVCAVVFLCFTIFGLITPFLPPTGHPGPNRAGDNTFANAAAPIVIAVMFGLAALFAWREGSRMSRATFVTDADGIWPKDVGKAQGLVPWSAIASMKERPQMQRLDLFDSTGRRLLGIDYQINGLATLKKMIYEKTSESTNLPSKRKFRKGVFYHLAWMGIILALPGFYFVLLHHVYPQFKYIVATPLAAIFIWVYIKQPFGIDINHQSLILVYPTKKKSIAFSNISKVDVGELFKDPANGNRIPAISLTLNNASKPIKLNGIGVPNNLLYAILRNALGQNGR